jgi:hypothetical protein
VAKQIVKIEVDVPDGYEATGATKLEQAVIDLNKVIDEIERINIDIDTWIDDLPPECDLTDAINSIDNAVDGIMLIQKKIKEQKQNDSE